MHDLLTTTPDTDEVREHAFSSSACTPRPSPPPRAFDVAQQASPRALATAYDFHQGRGGDAPSGGATRADTRQELIEALEASGEMHSSARLQEAIERAREEGREQAERAHREALDAMEARHLEALLSALGELERWREAMTHQSIEMLLRLIETLTMHLVKEALLDEPDRYVKAVDDALQALVGFDAPRLYVPPFALAPLLTRQDALEAMHPDRLLVEVMADEALEAGDFRLEVEGGEIEASLSRRLDRLVETCREQALAEFASWDEEG